MLALRKEEIPDELKNNNKIIATVTDIRGDKYIYTITKINNVINDYYDRYS